MASGFATNEFLTFASHRSSKASPGKIFQIHGDDSFPYLELEKVYCGTPANFIVTPICLSGPLSIDFEEFFSNKKLAKNSIQGGFIQSRCEAIPQADFVQFGDYCAYFDTRVNYRIPLSLNDEKYLSSLHRYSKYSIRKMMSSEADFSLLRVEGDEKKLEEFAGLYANTATRVGFAPEYHFDLEDWRCLLASRYWRLYLLYCDNSLIAGAVICEVGSGYDYTFIGNDPDVKDSSRALLYFVRKELSKESSGHLDIGGGIEEGDSLAKFKQNMGGAPIPFVRCRFGHQGLFANESEARVCLAQRWP